MSETTTTIPPENKRSLLGAVATFLYLIAVSLIILVVWSVWQTRVQTLNQSKGATANLALALSQHASNTILASGTILRNVVREVEKNDVRLTSPHDLHLFLKDTIVDQPMLSNLVVYDAQGKTVANSGSRNSPDATVADRAYFQFHKDSNDRGPHVGGPIVGRLTNEWVMTVSLRLNDPLGGFAGIALASVRVDFFRKYYEKFNIGNFGTILLASDTGELFVRLAQKDVPVGTSIANGPLFNEYRTKGPTGTAMLVARLDNTERLYSYRHLEQYPLIVAVALAKEDIFATWQAQTYQIISITTGLLLLLGMIGFRLVYMITAKDAIEDELRSAKDQLQELNGELETLASLDSLTGLANRRKFDGTLAIEFNRALRNHTSIALVMLDVDCFKQYNDLYGHPAGDECLRQIGRVLREQGPNRATDLPARYGGEEMVILLPDTDRTGAVAIAERIRLAIRELAIVHQAKQNGIVTISAGVAACTPQHAEHTAAQLIKAADAALYEAKATGRDRVCSNDVASTSAA
ncbi:MAG: sensor domain-containing diguanylate cyclase [Oxalicibacterium faecigallinarum]|uniref:sensor domain-containing diguanylate cyclase n=1 Tax=Oxalicibacterium faecigallinarum TaxID=573741 RepID=UPI0028067BFD|nr:sensor domain-containing diguanylate cyclase [Oxalicibacterium faecigallinarum]MDQ7970158.1 sensor domain-containing diguanylate cyclase [Oxalicibacterium faecigallinarum]